MTTVAQTANAAGPGGLTQNFGSAVSVGSSVVVWVGDYNTSGAVISSSTAPTYNGAAVTGAAKLLEVQSTVSGSSNIMYLAIWLLPNVASSGTSVTITAPANGTNDVNSHYYIAEVAGLGASPSVDGTSPNPASAFSSAGGTVSSGATGTAAGAGGIALGGMMQDGANTGWTGPAGWTTITTGSSYAGASYQVFTSSGTAYTWSSTGSGAGQWAAGAVILDATPAAAPAAEPPSVPHPRVLHQLLEEAWQRADWQAQGVADLTVAFSSSSGGVDTYNVTSPYNGTGSHPMRVLKPTAPSTDYPHAFLIMLPVEPDQNTIFGDSIGTAQTISAHNNYNLTIIQPGYAAVGGSEGPWYSDNPLDPTISQETFLLKVADWIRKNLATSGGEKTYLIGFSRSGLGGQGMQFRHPYLFAATASWDSPFLMTDYDGTDPTAGFTIGGNPQGSYGTSSNFQTRYQLTAAHLGFWQATGQYGVNRIWIGQGPSFPDTPVYDAALTTAGIPHTYVFHNTGETHAWQTDWVASALASIIPSLSSQAATTLPQQVPPHVLDDLLEVASYRLAIGSGGAGATAVSGGTVLGGAGSLGTAAALGAAAVLGGQGLVSASANVAQPGAAALTAAGSLTAAAAGSVSGAGSLAGAGSLGTAAVLGATAVLTGTASLTAGAAQGVTAALAGTGSLTAGATQGVAATMTAAGSLTASAGGAVSGAAALAGAGSLAGSGGPAGIATITGAGALTAGAGLRAVTTVTGAGALGTPGVVSAGAVLIAAGSLATPVLGTRGGSSTATSVTEPFMSVPGSVI